MPIFCYDKLNAASTAPAYGEGMIDTLTLALTHGLILLAAWRLMSRPDLNDDTAPEPAPAAKPEPGSKAGA